jgi:hypothetical protein
MIDCNLNIMVKINVLVNLVALIVLLSGFVMFILKNTSMAGTLILIGAVIYVYQRATHSEV